MPHPRNQPRRLGPETGALVLCIGFGLMVLSPGCSHELPDGHFACHPSDPDSCPPGFFCQNRGTTGQHLCYRETGGECGNGVADRMQGEVCDGEDFAGYRCSYGAPICEANCTVTCTVCGDKTVESRNGQGEECEEGDLGGATCESLGFLGGTLGCGNCQYDTTDCIGYCGDGLVQPELSEECDDATAVTQTCGDFGYFGGVVSCNDCLLDGSQCSGSLLRWTCGGQSVEGRKVLEAPGGDLLAVGVTYCQLGELPLGGERDGFVARVSPGGEQRFIRHWGTTTADYVTDAVRDGSALYIVGTTLGAFPPATNQGINDAVVSRLTLDGIVEWTAQWGTTQNDLPHAIAVGPDGSLYVAGETDGDFGSGAQGDTDLFVTKIDSAGVVQWTVTLGSSRWDKAFDIEVGSSGELYISGISSGTLGGVPAVGETDVIVARLDSSGAVVWLKRWAAESALGYFDNRILWDPTGDGQLWFAAGISGEFRGEPTIGDMDGVLMALDPQGNPGPVHRWGSGVETWEVLSLTAGAEGSVYIGGQVVGNPNGEEGGAVAKYSPTTNSVTSQVLEVTGEPNVNMRVYDLFQTSDGALFVTGVLEMDAFLLRTSDAALGF